MSIVSTQERHGVQQTALPTELGIESAADELSTLTLPSAHVLVAEDNLANQEVARLMLKGLGCQSTVVADGHEAVKAFCSGSYDVILMDCQMPDIRLRSVIGRCTPYSAQYRGRMTAR